VCDGKVEGEAFDRQKISSRRNSATAALAALLYKVRLNNVRS